MCFVTGCVTDFITDFVKDFCDRLYYTFVNKQKITCLGNRFSFRFYAKMCKLFILTYFVKGFVTYIVIHFVKKKIQLQLLLGSE